MAVVKGKKTSKKEDSNSAEAPKTELSKKEKALALLTAQFGKEIVVGGKVEVSRIPTGLIGFDVQLGGGWPEGRIGEFYGPEASGKTTIAQLILEAYQKLQKTTYFVDYEQALDRSYSAKLGVDVDEMIVTQPDNLEQGMDAMCAVTEAGAVDIIVADSVSAMTPKKEIEGDMGDSHMGLQARLMGQGLRKINNFASKNKVSLIFINQLRMKIGVMFGNPETTSGGNALKFYSSVRVDIRRVESIKEGDQVIGNKVKLKFVKNKVGIPFTERTYSLYFNEGYDRVGDLFDMAGEIGVIHKAGAHYSFEGVKLGNGRANALVSMRSNKEFTRKILELTVNKLVEQGKLHEDYKTKIDFVISLFKFSTNQVVETTEGEEVESSDEQEATA